MITLPIKKKWFDMILRGEKKEEYREIKPYWTKRFENEMHIQPIRWSQSVKLFDVLQLQDYEPHYYELRFEVKFKNGYTKCAPYFFAVVALSVGKGKVEWGAEKDKDYFVLKIIRFIDEEEYKVDGEEVEEWV